MLANPITQRYFESSTNLYLCSSDTRINFYNRHETICNKLTESGKLITDLEAVRNKLRFEVQYQNCYGELDKFVTRDFCESVVGGYYDMIIGSGDYYVMDKAMALISKNSKSIRKSIELKDFMKFVNQSGSIWQAKLRYLENSTNRIKSSKEFSHRLKQLRKIHLNPVTLPSEFGMDSLENVQYRLRASLSS